MPADMDMKDLAEVRSQALNAAHEGIAMFDGELRLVVWNDAYAKMYEMPAELLHRGAPLVDILRFRAHRGDFAPAAPDQAIAELLAAARQNDPHPRESKLPGNRFVELRRNALPGGGFVASFRDITEHKRVEQALVDELRQHAATAKGLRSAVAAAEAASRAKSEFLTNMSHELRTPLTAVLGFSDIIANESLGPVGVPTYREYARDIHDAGAHLLQVISAILDLARVEADRLDLQLEPVDAGGLAREAGNMMIAQAGMAGVALRLDLAEDVPPVLADAVRLRQALLNLLSNAIKFTPQGGTATLTTRFDRDRERVAITIADTGIGIAENDIGNALLPFGQVESALSRRFQGTGLGLPLARRFVEAMAGGFSLRSEVGRGTAVTLDFPTAG